MEFKFLFAGGQLMKRDYQSKARKADFIFFSFIHVVFPIILCIWYSYSELLKVLVWCVILQDKSLILKPH